MTRTLVALTVLLVAGTLSFGLRRRKTDAPPQVRGSTPHQVIWSDFSSHEKQWLVIVFTSSTCDACRDVAAKAQVLESREVTVKIVDYKHSRNLHERYQIDSVPTTVIADRAGVVRFSNVGPITATDLWAALARARQSADGQDPLAQGGPRSPRQ